MSLGDSAADAGGLGPCPVRIKKKERSFRIRYSDLLVGPDETSDRYLEFWIYPYAPQVSFLPAGFGS